MINLAKVNEVLSPIPKYKLAVSAAIGAAIGLFGALVVNACLLEISLNGFFTIYFSLIFLTVGGFMIFRNRSRQGQTSMRDSDETFMHEEKNRFFEYAAWLVLFSGLLCLVLERSWAQSFPYLLKVPIYAVVAMSLNYLVLFAIIDFVNFICSYLQSENSLNVVETQDQILTLLINCFACGTLYGLIFSILDVEDA